MLIPNFFLDRYTKATDLMIACKFYSMIGSFTKRNSKGYELSIKEKTLADICGCSVATVRRSLQRLCNDGLVISMHRPHRPNGTLGTYIYTIKDFACDRGYFSINKRAFEQLSPKAFQIYVWFCRLRGGSCNSFYQSLSDLQRITGVSRSRISAIINELVRLRLVYKQRKKTRCGDYTDNTYFVVVYIRSKRIYKKMSHRLSGAMTQAYKSMTYTNKKKLIYYVTDICKKSLAHYIKFLYINKERCRL
ncbi:regulatory protein Crp [Ruminococcus sp. CAG:579]|nr:regulatory protein Crp [Ruminococcus sp. CAG:579]